MPLPIKVNQLTEGYMLGEDIYFNSTIRYHRDTYVTPQIIDELIDKGIDTVKVLTNSMPQFHPLSGSAILSPHDSHMLTERFQNDMAPLADELRYGRILHSETSYRWLRALYMQLFSNPTVRLLMDSLKYWDPICYIHSIDVFVFCSLYARHSKEKFPDGFIIGALLHDIGKLYTPRSILLKTGKLTEREYVQITHHSADGAALLSRLGFNDETSRIARSHHERLNGCGYPDHIAITKSDGDLKIIMIADVYSALTLNRSYRKPMPATKALEILLRDTVSQHLFDRQTCYRFIEFISIYPPATKVILSNGLSGSILENSEGSDILPRIKLDELNKIIQLPNNLSLIIREITDWDINQLHREAKQLWADYIHYLIEGNSLRALKCLELLSDGKRVENVFVDIFALSLEEIGQGCLQGRWSPADELIARTTTTTLLDWRMLRFAPDLKETMGRILIVDSSRPKYLVDYKMIDFLLSINGWRTYFVAEEIEPSSIMEMIEKKNCDYLALSLTSDTQLASTTHLLQILAKLFPDLTIFLHGNCANHCEFDNPPHIKVSTSLAEFIKCMNACFPSTPMKRP